MAQGWRFSRLLTERATEEWCSTASGGDSWWAWDLLLSMLPEHHAIGTHSYTPKYRNWQTKPPRITHSQLGEMYAATAERVVEDAGADTERWVQLVGRLDDLPPQVLPKALGALQTASEEGPTDLRQQVWEQMRDLVMKHRRFSHTDWSLDREVLDQLDELQQSLAPGDPGELVRWLFDEHVPNIPVENGEEFDFARFDEEP